MLRSERPSPGPAALFSKGPKISYLLAFRLIHSGSSRQNGARTQRLEPWKIRGICSRYVGASAAIRRMLRLRSMRPNCNLPSAILRVRFWGRTCRNLQNPEDLTSNAMLERQTTTICDCSFRGGPLFSIEKCVGTVSGSSSIIRHGVAVYEEFGDSLGTAI
jgi:hypothetical protein